MIKDGEIVESCSTDSRHQKRLQNFSSFEKIIGSCVPDDVYSKWTVFILLCGHRDSKKGGKFLYHSQLQRTTLHGVYETLF
jgi:hypothetical protein